MKHAYEGDYDMTQFNFTPLYTAICIFEYQII